MLALEKARVAAAALAALPVLAIAGLFVMAAGAALDVTIHLDLGHADGHAAPHLEEDLAHLVGVIGMVLVWVGVVVYGVRRQFRQFRQLAEKRSRL